MISLEKWYILTPLQKLHKNVGGLGKFIVAKGLKSCSKSNKSPNQVTLLVTMKKNDLSQDIASVGSGKFRWFFPLPEQRKLRRRNTRHREFSKISLPAKMFQSRSQRVSSQERQD